MKFVEESIPMDGRRLTKEKSDMKEMMDAFLRSDVKTARVILNEPEKMVRYGYSAVANYVYAHRIADKVKVHKRGTQVYLEKVEPKTQA